MGGMVSIVLSPVVNMTSLALFISLSLLVLQNSLIKKGCMRLITGDWMVSASGWSVISSMNAAVRDSAARGEDSQSFSHIIQAVFFPTHFTVVLKSQPVSAWNTGSATHRFLRRREPLFEECFWSCLLHYG